eukprot:14471-Rhodomonas_salina.2
MNLVRIAIPGHRRRYVDNKFDLDLTYITGRIIAMAFPAEVLDSHPKPDIPEPSSPKLPDPESPNPDASALTPTKLKQHYARRVNNVGGSSHRECEMVR